MVIVRLRPRGSIKQYPFLKEPKCSINNSKPTVCALYPLGRSLRAGESNGAGTMQAEVNYIFQNPTCCDISEIHTVRQWLNQFDFLTDEEYFKTWMQLIADCWITASALEGLCSEEVSIRSMDTFFA